MRHFFRTLLVLAFVMVGSPAHAQVPSSAEPSRAEEQLNTQLPKKKDQPAGRVEEEQGEVKEHNPGAFHGTARIEGMTVYTQDDLAPLYEDNATLRSLAGALTTKYRRDGYILAQVVVAGSGLRVYEGYVDSVSVKGDTNGNDALLLSIAEQVRAARPMNASDLERATLLISDLPGIVIHTVLSPSRAQGAATLAMTIEQKKVDVVGQINNRGTRYLGPIQVNGFGRANDVFGFNDSLTLHAANTPDGQELKYGGLTYARPLGTHGTLLTVAGSITSTEPGYTLSSLDVEGLARRVSVVVKHPFIRSRLENFFATARFDYLNSHRSDNSGDDPVRDHVRALRVGGEYQIADRLNGFNTLSVEASRGLNVLGASKNGSDNLTRPLGRSDFTKATAEITRLQRVTRQVSVMTSASGQKSADTLLSSEEFGVGGARYGGAYDYSELTGEDGLAGKVELRFTDTAPGLNSYQLFGYYDIGTVWNRDADTADDQDSLASVGLGIRTSFNDNFSTSVELARPLTRTPATEDSRALRFFGSVTGKF